MKSKTPISMVVLIGLTLSAQAQLTWTNRISEPISQVRTIKYVNGGFIAAGDMGTVWTSPDGANWTRRDLGTLSTLEDIAYGNGRTVIIGDGVVATSADGTNWTLKSGVSFSSVVYGGGRFAACQPGRTASSADGTRWVSLSGLGGGLGLGLAFGEARFASLIEVPPAPGGYSWGISVGTSGDGIMWTNSDAEILPYSLQYQNYAGMVYGNGLFCAFCLQPDPESFRPIGTAFAVSADGVGWANFVVQTNLFLKKMLFANGMFLAFSVNSDGSAGVIHASTDGRSWFDSNLQPPTNCQAITFGNGTYVAVGGGGASDRPDGFIAQSSSISGGQLSASVVRDQGIQVRVLGEVGRSYQLQASPSVAGGTWSNLADFRLAQPFTNYVDPKMTNLPTRFYRLSSP